MTATVVRTLTVRSREEGAPQVARALHGVADAYKTVVRTSQEGARVIDMTASKLASTERGWERLTGRLEGNAAAYKTFVRQSTLAKQALDAGMTTVERYSEVVGHLRQELQAAGTSKFGIAVDQSSLNAILGINTAISKSAREVAAVFEEEARAAESAAAEAGRHAARLDDLRASFDPTHDAARKMADELDRLAELERAGVAIMGGYEAALDKIVLKYDDAARAAAGAAAAQSKVIEQARAEQMATNAAADGQSKWNAYAGVRSASSGSARNSASVFEEDAKAMEELQDRALKLRAELDPLGAAYDRMTTAITGHQELADRGVITQDELVRATSRSREAFDKTAAALLPVNDNVRLTSNQMQVLSYQANDAATMLLSGASAGQVVATQFGQVAQVLGDNPDGIVGGMNSLITSAKDGADTLNAFMGSADSIGKLKEKFSGTATAALGLMTSLGSLALNPIVLGAVALAAGLAYIALRATATEKAIEASAKAMKSYETAVEMATRGNSEFATSIDVARTAAVSLTARQAQAALMADIEKQREAVKKAKEALPEASISVRGGLNPIPAFQDLFRVATGEGSTRTLDKLGEQLASGAKSAAQVRAELQEFRVSPDLPDYLKDAVDKMVTLATAIADAEANMKALTGATDRFLKSQSEARYDAARKDLSSFIPDPQTDRERINRAYQTEVGRIRNLRGVRGDERQELEADAIRRKTAALGELDRVETNRRAGYELDLKSITARTAAEKADIEAQRIKLELLSDPTFDKSQIPAREEEARQKSLAQSREQLNEAIRQQSLATTDQVAQARLELELVGKSAGETARLRTEFDLLAEAKRAARDAGFDENTVAMTDEMKRQAGAIGEATAALEKLNFERDIQFRTAQAGRSEQDQRIAQDLYSAGIDLNSAEGERRAGMLRYVEAIEKAGDATRDLQKATKDAFSSIVDAIGSGENAFDAFIAGFAQIGQKLTSQGFDRLFDGMFDGKQIAASVEKAVSSTSVAKVSSSTIERYALPPISTSAALDASPQVKVWKFFASKGLSETAIAGIMGNVHAESAFNARAVGDSGKALGLFQWNDRAQNLKDFAGDWTDMNSQLEFAWKELNTSERGVLDRLKKTTNVAEATQVFLGFERPQGYSKNNPTASHNYSGRLNAAEKAYATYAGDDRVTSKVVSDGVIDAQKKIATGAVPLPTARPTATEGGVNMNVGTKNLLGGMTGKDMLGGALGLAGIAANGYSSGSALGGGLGGAMAGFQLGGPVGAVVGGVVGLVSGLFGKSKAKKEAQKQKWAQAEEAWQQNLPAFRQLEDEVTRTERGPLSSKIKELGETLKQFDELAKKGKGDRNNDQIRRVRAEMADYIAFLSENFTADLPQVISDLGKGNGLDTSFTKARDAVMAQADSYRGFLKDIQDAYAVPVDQRAKILADYEAAKSAAGTITKRVEALREDSRGNVYRTYKTETIKQADPAALAAAAAKRDTALAAFDAKYGDALARMNAQLEAARAAAIEGLLRIVSGDIPEQTDIQKAIEEARGAASGLRTALVDLGMSADDTAVAIDKALAQRMTKLGTEFSQGLLDDINETNGKGYLAGFRDLIKARDKNLSDAASLPNVDTSLVSDWFKSQAQSIVDGAELTGDAFADLIKAFPELSGVVKEFAQEATNTAAEIAQRLQGFYDRFATATTDTSTLSGAMAMFARRAGQERAAEVAAGGQGLVALDAALAAEKAQTIKGLLVSAYDAERQSVEDLIGSLESFRDQVRDTRKSLRLDDNLSVLGQREQAFEAQKEFREILAKANAGDKDAQAKLASAGQTYLEEFRAYFKSSVDYYNAFEEVQTALANSETLADQQLTAAKSQLETIKAQLDALNGIKDGVTALLDAYKAATAAASDAANKAGLGGGSAGGGSATPVGTASNLSPQSVRYLANNADVAAAIANGNTFGLKAGFAPEVYAAAHYGLYGQTEGRGWAAGGYTGPGGVNEVAGDVHRGEVVFSQADVARHGGVGSVEALRLSRPALPSFEQMVPRQMRAPLPASNDNALRLAKLEKLMAMLITTTGEGLQRVAEAAEANADSADDLAANQRRTASRGRK